MLLETYFPEDYFDIRKEESPDLRMGDARGIEVTWAMFENQGQANGILNHIKGKTVNQIDQRYVETMSRIQTEIFTGNDGIICGYTPMDTKNKASYKEIIKAYNKKKGSQFRNRQPANHTAGPLPRQYTVRSGRLHVPPAFFDAFLLQ